MEANGCLISILKKLKESSKEAVENLNSFSNFKEYMHINRRVETELLEILDKSSRESKSQLILVCGGVGDGKSHLISYFKNKYPDMMEEFILHNDATESFEPEKTSIDTLNEVLDAFCDEKLGVGETKKLILAINLGALNNFIDSKHKDRFKELIAYVNDMEILETTIQDHNFDRNSFFQYINFSDYHMYSLTKQGPKSDYMKAIIDKVTSSTDENPFYQGFMTLCSSCRHLYNCPIKANYEMLSRDDVKENMISMLIETIVKKKVIISTRSLLNFIYDLLVNSELDNLSNELLLDRISRVRLTDYMKYNFTSNLFEHSELSHILEAITEVDPIRVRKAELDALIIKLHITDDLSSVFSNYLDLKEDGLLKDIILDHSKLNYQLDEMKVTDQARFKKDLIKLFVRLQAFIGKEQRELNLEDQVYKKYMENLFYWNNGEAPSLSNLYEDIYSAIYKWNGEIQLT